MEQYKSLVVCSLHSILKCLYIFHKHWRGDRISLVLWYCYCGMCTRETLRIPSESRGQGCHLGSWCWSEEHSCNSLSDVVKNKEIWENKLKELDVSLVGAVVTVKNPVSFSYSQQKHRQTVQKTKNIWVIETQTVLHSCFSFKSDRYLTKKML